MVCALLVLFMIISVSSVTIIDNDEFVNDFCENCIAFFLWGGKCSGIEFEALRFKFMAEKYKKQGNLFI